MNKYRQEYIGHSVTIVSHPNTTLTSTQGKIRDETKHTFLVETQNKLKTVPKQGATFTINNNTIDGTTITKRPHDRIKMKL